MSAHAPTSRTREAPQGDEEASAELKLGEFQDVDALTHSEAALVINALVAKRSADRKNVNETEYALFLLLLEERMRRGGIIGVVGREKEGGHAESQNSEPGTTYTKEWSAKGWRVILGPLETERPCWAGFPIWHIHAGLTDNRMLSKTRDYLDHFARFKRKENVEAVERLLSAHKELAKFERAQLGSYSLPPPNMKANEKALERDFW
jgi:RNA polymerase Rpb4